MGLAEKTTYLRRKKTTFIFFLPQTLASSSQRHFHHHSQRIPISIPSSTFFSFILASLILMLTVAEAAAQVELKVNEFGVRKINSGDMAMVFYANISHTGGDGSGPMVARLHMDKCCVQVPPDQKLNCQAMKLISGLGKVFRPKENYILQMYFVNFDLLDREGSCNIRLLSRSPKNQDQANWDKGEAFTVPFKTVLKKPGALGKLIMSLGGSSEGYRICDSDNYNALHDCSNFDDCLVRYSGELSLFNKTSGECVKTPECQDHNSTFLSFITRKCSTIHQISRTVRETFSYDMQYVDNDIFSKGPSIPASLLQRNNASNSSSPSPSVHSQLVCEHGYHVKGKNGRDNCTCHPGWRSLTIEEWQQKGGVYMDNWETNHKMCTVPLIDQRTRGLLLLGFLFVCLIIPFIAMLWCNRSKNKSNEKSQSRVKKPPSSLAELEPEESESKQNIKEKPEKNKCNIKSSHRVLNEMEDEEANKVISEITNRREPTLSKKSSKRDKSDKDDDDESGNPLPPSSSQPSVPPSSKSSTVGDGTAFTGSKTSQQEGGSRVQSSTSFQSTRQASRSMMPPNPPPPAPTTPSSSRSAVPSPSQPMSSLLLNQSSGGGPSVSKTSHLSYYSPSSTGFDYTESIVEEGEVNQRRRFDKLNMNVATQVPSTDDLLTMNRREKYGAHVPIQPVGENLGVSVMVADCATVELNNDMVMLNSLSSEEITQKKQQEWAQFIESMSEEKIQFKPGHLSMSVESRNTIENFMEEDDEEEGEAEHNSRLSRQSQSQLTDFHYFHKDHNHNNKGKATKVQSVPGMMTYHPFSSMTTYHNQETDLPEPPVHFIQKALNQLPPEENESRHDAYRILSSLSHERILSSRNPENDNDDGMLKLANSIWSNIASENTNELSGTPATSAFGSGVESSCDEEVDTIRAKTIYGNLGSDVDSDDALDEIALNNNKLDPNRTIYGCPPIAPMYTTTQIPPMNSQQAHDSLESVTRPPSEVFIDSTDASTVTSRTVSSTHCDFWKNIAGQSDGARTTTEISSETNSAYQIKSSLETTLKASRSRSGTNLF